MREPISNYLTIVTGHPRSGTSMMMQMLQSGGVNVFSDGMRVPDADNPQGYFEHEAIKHLGSDNSWLYDVRGSAIKIVLYLLRYLPKDINYRVIFMVRPIDEILASQTAMLERRGDSVSRELNIILREKLLAIERAIRSVVIDYPFIETMEVEYYSVLAQPRLIASNVAHFLGGGLNIEAMADVVNPHLYRQRDGQL